MPELLFPSGKFAAEAGMRDLPPDRGREPDRDGDQPLPGEARGQEGQDQRRGVLFAAKGHSKLRKGIYFAFLWSICI